MGYITNELSDRIGRIDDNGYVFDTMGNCFAQVTDSGYITAVAGWDTYGKIDEDGTIRDVSMDVIGRIQADGYVYIHSRRVGKVSSAFVERITPYAWNVGQSSSYKGRHTPATNDSDSSYNTVDFLFSPFFLKLIAGIALGIYAMVEGAGGLEMLVAGPVCVFVLTFLFKIFAFIFD